MVSLAVKLALTTGGWTSGQLVAKLWRPHFDGKRAQMMIMMMLLTMILWVPGYVSECMLKNENKKKKH